MCSPTRHICPCPVVKAREGNYGCFFNEDVQEFLQKCFILYRACRVFVHLAKVDIWNKLEPRIWKDILFMRTDTPKEVQLYFFHERKKESSLKSFAWSVIETFSFLSCISMICFVYFFYMWFPFKLELEQQKIQEEQENAPEFVKVKGNLRRTVQEATEAPDS